jgi:phosphatidylinositol glycan class V
MKVDYSRRVIYLAAISRLFTVILAMVSSVGFNLDNKRNSIVFGPTTDSNWIYNLVNPLVQWDGIHFLNIAARGYDSLLEHAFFPGLPFSSRVAAYLLPFSTENATLSLALAGVVIVQLSFVMAALGLYRISTHFLGSHLLAFRATLFYIFPSSNIFMSAMYTESPFSMLTFWGIYWLYAKKRLWMSVLFFSAATLFRSNGILAMGSILHEAIRSKKRVFEGVVAAGAVYLPYYLFSVWSYNLYCNEAVGGVRHAWCYSYTSIYGYIQKEFWMVAPFAYWKIHHIPYFLLMTPALTVAIYGFVWRAKERYTELKMILRSTKWSLTERFNILVGMWDIGLIAQMGILTTLTVFVANCQILTRILSSCPLFFWSAERMYRESSPRLQSVILAVQLGYFLMGPFVFGNGFNWT